MTQTLTPANRAALRALSRFFFLAWRHDHGGARVAARLILGLYNGTRFPFDLTDLRLLDGQMLEDAMALMLFDARIRMEVHDWLNKVYGRGDFGERFEHLAHMWNLKGKCKKEWLAKLEKFEPAVLFHEQQEGGAV